MIEDLIEKAKQYKIALGLGLLGVIAAGFILLQGRDQGGTDVQQLTEQSWRFLTFVALQPQKGRPFWPPKLAKLGPY